MNNLIQFIVDFVEDNRKQDWLSFEDANKFGIIANQLAILKAQRDEARREICKGTNHPEMEAEERGWDCFKEVHQ